MSKNSQFQNLILNPKSPEDLNSNINKNNNNNNNNKV
jgi:hypothetical protein